MLASISLVPFFGSPLETKNHFPPAFLLLYELSVEKQYIHILNHNRIITQGTLLLYPVSGRNR